MRPVLFTLLFAFLAPVAGFSEHPAADAEGFTVVYDGKNLDGVETEGNWQIQEDGSLFLKPREGEEGWKRYGSYLWLKNQYAGFVCDFEFKYEEGGNSGFYFRVYDQSDASKHGFEVQILDSLGKEEMGHHDMGGVIRTKGASKNMSKPAGEWNRMTVTMKGSHLTVVLNGEKIQDFDLAKEKKEGHKLVEKGWICIQDHGQPFWVRNIRIKELP